jgi:hypothetical protein
MTADKVSKEGPTVCGSDYEAETEPHGTATLFRCTLSDVLKSLSKKWFLKKYLLYTILAE